MTAEKGPLFLCSAGYAQSFATPSPAVVDYGTSRLCFHAKTETMGAFTFSVTWLECSFTHDLSFYCLLVFS